MKCPLNTKTKKNYENLCYYGKDICPPINDVVRSRYYIENNECKYCKINFILVDG